MTGTVEYYVGQREIQQDNQWLAALSDSIASAITAIAGVGAPGTSKVIEFTVGAFTSGTTSYATANVSLDLEIVDSEYVRIGQRVYLNSQLQLVDGLLDAAITTAATIYIEGGVVASLAAGGLTLTSAGVAFVGIATGAGVALAYSKFLDTPIEAALDLFSDGVDTNIQLKDANGEILSGVLYKDGLSTSSDLLTAVEGLLLAGSQGGISCCGWRSSYRGVSWFIVHVVGSVRDL